MKLKEDINSLAVKQMADIEEVIVAKERKQQSKAAKTKVLTWAEKFQ